MSNPEELLKKGFRDLGISISPQQVRAFLTFLTQLKKWNRTYSLTSLNKDKDIIVKHFLDSALYLKAIPGSVTNRKLADIGTGAGFPGIPIKILCPKADITLLEPSRKKTAFLRHILRTLQFKEGVTVLEKTIEALGQRYEESFDCIMSRATFTIGDFLKKACPYARKDGRLVLSKGPKVFGEIDSLDAAKRHHIEKIIQLRLMEHERNLLVLSCSTSHSALS